MGIFTIEDLNKITNSLKQKHSDLDCDDNDTNYQDAFLNSLISDIKNSNKKPIEIIKQVLANNKIARLLFRREGIDNFLPKINQNIEIASDKISSRQLIELIDAPVFKLNEISLQQTSSADLEDKKPEKAVGLFKSYSGIDFYKTKGFKDIGDGLLEIFSDGNYVGKLNLGFVKRYKLPEIDQVFLNSEFRGKGYAEKIYAFVLDTFGGIVSGYIQTPGSKKLWVKLAKIYDVYIEDGKGNFYQCEINGTELQAPVKIYGNSNVLLCFKNTPSWLTQKLKINKVKSFVESILKEVKEAQYKYGVVMLDIDFPELETIHNKIDKTDLYEDDTNKYGLENKSHITLLYGLHKGVSLKDVEDSLTNINIPAKLKLTKISLFENEKYDVLKFDVKIDSLGKINKKLSELPYTSEYDEYKPHVTIAYLKKGKGKKYTDKFKDLNYEVKTTKVRYNEASGDKHVLK